MRFHIPGLTHTQTNKDFTGCAFSMKVLKLCKMLTKAGHTVFHYGVEGSNPFCTENIIVASKELQQKHTPANWREVGFSWNGEDELHKTFYNNAVAEMKKRVEQNDFFLASWGWGHKQLSDAVADKCIIVEPGIGYDATFAKFRVFESYTWMNYIYGKQNLGDGAFYDAVIPNYFEPEDFTFREKKEDWLLYVGRIIKRKGIELAIQIAEALKTKIVIAGQGALKNPNEGLDLHSDYMEYVGYADVEKRKDLMSRAKCMIAPTYYVEPFGGVVIEAAISGCPTITTDWGVFGETVLHGTTGYRCRTFEQFCWAVKNTHRISPRVCRQWAIENFSCDRVTGMFEEYFQMLLDLHTKQQGWYAAKPERTQLDWLNRKYPVVEPQKVEPKPAVKPPTIIIPIENAVEYALPLDWYDLPKEPGITFLVRAKNEEKTIGICLDSLKQLKIPYEINVFLNQCTDHTEEEVVKRKEQGMPIRVYKYPFVLAKPGLQHNVTPANSVHAYSWMINWCLTKGTKKYTMKWDADFILTHALAEELAVVSLSDTDIAGGSAVYLDTLGDNWEPYLFSNEVYPRYVKYASFESIAFGNDAEDVSYLKKYTLKAKILHDSSLKELKAFWQDQLWWDLEPSHPHAKTAKERYAELKEKLGNLSLISRASCPEADKLYNALCTISPCRDDLVSLQDYVFNLYAKNIRTRQKVSS